VCLQSLPRGFFAAGALVVLAGGCHDLDLPDVRSATRVSGECSPYYTEAYFFPAVLQEGFNRDPGRHNAQIASGYLRAAGAESLSCGLRPAEGYRLARLGVGIPGTVISVIRGDQGWVLTVAEFSSPQPDKPSYELAKNASRTISAARVGALLEATTRSSFWTASADPGDEGEGRILLIEGRLDESYRVVTRPAGEGYDGADMNLVVKAFLELAANLIDER
jgi:hypothetical protein